MIKLFSEPIFGEMHHCLMQDDVILLIRWGDLGLNEIIASIDEDYAGEEIKSVFNNIDLQTAEPFEISLEIDIEQDGVRNIQVTSDDTQTTYSDLFNFHESNALASILRGR